MQGDVGERSTRTWGALEIVRFPSWSHLYCKTEVANDELRMARVWRRAKDIIQLEVAMDNLRDAYSAQRDMWPHGVEGSDARFLCAGSPHSSRADQPSASTDPL